MGTAGGVNIVEEDGAVGNGPRPRGTGDNDNDYEDNDYDDNKDELGARAQRWWHHHDNADNNRRRCPQGDPALRTLMGHSGCINTASWLDCRWRISTATPSSLHSSNDHCNGIYVLPSSECPTQLLTSGNNVLVKF
jgi:hypothetical protein